METAVMRHPEHTTRYVTITEDEYESLVRTIEVLKDPELMEQLKKSYQVDLSYLMFFQKENYSGHLHLKAANHPAEQLILKNKTVYSSYLIY